MADMILIRQQILEVHQRMLGGHLVAVVQCGSMTDDDKVNIEGDDVDFVVVVDQLDGEVFRACAEAHSELSKIVPASVSNTLITRADAELSLDEPEMLSGKAVQALYEVAKRPEWILGAAPGFTVDLPSDDVIRRFSVYDFNRMVVFVRNLLGRAEPDLSYELQHKMAKVTLIALKMKLQYDDPRRFADPDGPRLDGDMSESDAAVHQMIQRVKGGPGQCTPAEQVAVTAQFFIDTQAHFRAVR